jgi:phospholipase/carboxylesterase/glyoxalase family protein
MLPGAAVLAPRGKVLEQGMPRFFRRLAVGVLDAEELAQRAHELADFVEAAAAHYHFDPARVVAVGYSNGANIASAVLLLRPSVLAGALLFRPMLIPIAPDPLPDLSAVRIGVLGGESDELTPRESTIRLAQRFAKCGAQVDLSWARGGHGLMPDDFAASVEWMKRWTK